MSGFRSYLVARRRDLGLSQAAVAERMGTKQSAVSELETGETPNPTLNTLVSWAAAVELELQLRFTARINHTFPVAAEGT